LRPFVVSTTNTTQNATPTSAAPDGAHKGRFFTKNSEKFS